MSSELNFSEHLQDAIKVHFVRNLLEKESHCVLSLYIPQTWHKRGP